MKNKTITFFCENAKEINILNHSTKNQTWEEFEKDSFSKLKNIISEKGYKDILLYRESPSKIKLFCRRECIAFRDYDKVFNFIIELN